MEFLTHFIIMVKVKIQEQSKLKTLWLRLFVFLLSFHFAMALKDLVLLKQMKQKIETTWIEHTYTLPTYTFEQRVEN